MKKFAESYENLEVVQALPGRLPWTHNLILLERVKDPQARAWYANKTLENGWAYRMLITHIKENLYEAQGQKEIKTTNFQLKLLSPQSDRQKKQ